MVDVMDNHVIGTTERGISLGEMSMDMASGNVVEGAEGSGSSAWTIRCATSSTTRSPARSRRTARTRPRQGVAIEAYFYAEATVAHNTVIASPGGVQAFDNSTIQQPVSVPQFQLVARTGHPGFLDLPWERPLEEWESDRFVEVVRGISRHVVRFVEYDGALYALKELPERPARREYTLLRELAAQGVPVVEAVGLVTGTAGRARTRC